MKGQNLAVILMYVAVLLHLLTMSGWLNQAAHQPFQLGILACLLLALFALRKRKRKRKRRSRTPSAQVQALVDHAQEREAKSHD
ncbi:hypothetical protein ACAF76_011545 [Brevibacillus sp. TJ4]|uniref:hypothetical protein n=1 Tax=Brevibacillus sp. TJ4 TaxID=3234853 RepID=UPI0037D35882